MSIVETKLAQSPDKVSIDRRLVESFVEELRYLAEEAIASGADEKIVEWVEDIADSIELEVPW
jgi:hypothetical protein